VRGALLDVLLGVSLVGEDRDIPEFIALSRTQVESFFPVLFKAISEVAPRHEWLSMLGVCDVLD